MINRTKQKIRMHIVGRWPERNSAHNSEGLCTGFSDIEGVVLRFMIFSMYYGCFQNISHLNCHSTYRLSIEMNHVPKVQDFYK